MDKLVTPDSPKEDQLSFINQEETDLDTHWQLRNARMMEVREVLNLIRPPKKQDQSNWVTNEPKVFFDTARALVSINPPRFKLPININHDPDEKEKMNKAERFLIGIWREMNRSVINRGGVSWLWDLSYWALLGWYAVGSIIEKKNGKPKFRVDVYDPYTIKPMWDNEELIKVTRTYETDKMTAIQMADDIVSVIGGEFYVPGSESPVKVTNYWRKYKPEDNDKTVVENAIVVAGQLVKPLTVQTKMQDIPIMTGAIGSPDRTFPNWMIRQGESILDANFDTYEYTNVMLRLLAEIMAQNVYGNLVSKTRTGASILRGRQLKGHGEEINLRIGDSLEVLRHATTPDEVNRLADYFFRQIQKGSIPDVVYGGVPGELSGFAISQLLAAIKYKLSPYLNALQSIIENVMQNLLYQYRVGNYGDITLTTENPYDIKRGMTYFEEFSKDDVPEVIHVEVEIPISTQLDRTTAIQNSVTAFQNGLLSRETLWETELNVQDAEQERERLRDDKVDQDPFVVGIEIIDRMWRKVELYESQGRTQYAQALRRYIMQKEMSLGMRQGVPTRPGENPLPRPETLPPEMSMTPNPDETRAMFGQPPPKPTPREQLVSPTGEPL